MKSYLVIILLSLFFSCDFGMPAEQKEYLNGIESVYPSLKEDLFKSELERNGYSNINYTIPNIGLYELGKSEYRIELDCDFSLNNKN